MLSMGGRAESRLFSAPRASVCANCNGVYLVEFWKQPHLPDIGATSSMILRPKANDGLDNLPMSAFVGAFADKESLFL